MPNLATESTEVTEINGSTDPIKNCVYRAQRVPPVDSNFSVRTLKTG